MRSRWNSFQSPLAEGIQHFLTYKRALGQRFHTEEMALRLLDAFWSSKRCKPSRRSLQSLLTLSWPLGLEEDLEVTIT